MHTPRPGFDASEIFSNARALPEGERSGYLDRACGGDAVIRAELEALLLALPSAQELFRDPRILGQACDALQAQTDLPPGRQVGNYQIIRLIATGGMASVYLADDLKHHRNVALKVMHPEIAAAIGHDRFLREIDIAAQLTHPHILPLYDSGTDGSTLYYVMPHIEGDSLRARLEREGRLPIEESLRLALQVAGALGHAHAHGIVHRDVKPENILISQGFALVADFGIARIAQSSATEPAAPAASPGRGGTNVGLILGTPGYMAPEQSVEQTSVDGRADQYSLACVLYEMLAGQAPFPGTDRAELMVRHARVSVPPLGAARADLSPGVSRAVERALSKLADERFPTMAAFAEALEVAGNGGEALADRPAAEAHSTPNNLPRQRTRFIGRERELDECTARWVDGRQLTLTGIGGSGKTRLALRLAEMQLANHPDGVWFVDFAPLQDIDRVPLALATALNVHEVAGTPLVDSLIRRLGDSQTFLVLDNCEHVLRAAAEYCATLLAHCPRIRIVVTSREALGIEGERTVEILPLGLPALGAVEPAAMAGSEAVRLFVDRARIVDVNFMLDAACAGPVAEICRRLDGIPLAIELAAARVSVLSVEEIRARLDDRFRLLTGSGRGALPRHQTLQATIQWSYDLLEPGDQRLFRLLSVFAGGWSLAAAAAVGADGADQFQLLDAISRLVRKSLVVFSREATGVSRYFMLETVGQYARERLAEAGAEDEARSRHLAHYVVLATEAEQGLSGPEQGAWLTRLQREQENLLLAHEWCDGARERGESGLALMAGTQTYWLLSGHVALGHRLLLEALRRPGAEGRSLSRCKALSASAQFSSSVGNLEQAWRDSEEALSIARELGDRDRMPESLRLLGLVALNSGDLAAARAYSEECLAVARELGEPVRIARALNVMGEICRQEGSPIAAGEYYAESIARHRELRAPDNTAIGLTNLSMVMIEQGESARAREMLREAQAIARATGSKRAGQSLLDVSAGFWVLIGDWARAAKTFGALEAHRELIGLSRERADDAFLLPLMTQAREAMGTAEFAVAEAHGRALSYDEALDIVGSWLGADGGADTGSDRAAI